jgi:hypothetical protein
MHACSYGDWLLTTVGEFYADTSTMRLTGESLKYGGNDCILMLKFEEMCLLNQEK